MKNTLQEYVDQLNRWGSIFSRDSLDLQYPSDRQRIADHLASDLSPENLTCDGELRGQALIKRSRFLNACVKELRELDPSIVIEI